MYIEKLPPEQQALLDSFEEAGGVVDLVVLNRDVAERNAETYRQAALMALDAVGAQWDQYFTELVKLPDYQNYKRNEFFSVNVSADKLTGHRIDRADFLGNQFLVNENCLLVRGRHSNYLNNYFREGDPETDKTCLSQEQLSRLPKAGFSDAFLSPPYNLQISNEDACSLFWQIAHVFLSDLDKAAEIWSWSTECSNYFEAGHEWWGSHFYTFSHPDSDRVIAVLASATD